MISAISVNMEESYDLWLKDVNGTENFQESGIEELNYKASRILRNIPNCDFRLACALGLRYRKFQAHDELEHREEISPLKL